MECDFDPIPFKRLDPTITISVKPMLFLYQQYEECGGWFDFDDYYETVEDAKARFLSLIAESKDFRGHIVEDGKVTWVWVDREEQFKRVGDV